MLALDMLRGAADAGAQPTLDLNFTSGTLDSRVTYTGASLATLTDATGAIAYKPHNLLTYSGDLSNAVWTKTLGASTTSGSVTIGTGAASEARNIIYLLTASKTFTASVQIAVASGTAKFRIKNTHGGVVDNYSSDLTATTTPQWFSLTVNNAASAGDGSQTVGIANASDASSNGVTFLVTGAQLNIGPLQPYYPTTSAAYYGPRFTYDPVTLSALGLLIEEQRTQLLLNSLIDGTNLSTHSVTVTAQAYTLSFFGTGTITLSGTSTGAKVGTGAYPTRSTFTFTPTAGTLTLTVTGTVQYAQLEAGSFATSFIPSAGASVTRAADSATMTGSNFSSWFNATQGTFVVDAQFGVVGTPSDLILAHDGSTTNSVGIYMSSSKPNQAVNAGGVSQTAQASGSAWTLGATSKVAASFAANDFRTSNNGAAVVTDSVGSMPSGLNAFSLGGSGAVLYAGAKLNATIARLRYYNTALTNAQLQALTT